jgi:methylated-DNA-[protein]-cysteine S-methyltransferase
MSSMIDKQLEDTLSWTIFESPLGSLTILGGPQGIRNVHFPGRSPKTNESARRPMEPAIEQLEQYFAGERRAFELDLDLRGTPLQRRVWAELEKIPYGSTTSYGELARRIDDSLYPDRLEPYERVRLVGATIGRTPTPILVPCHRVIGADGSLTGYGGGLQRKQALLELEGAMPAEKPAKRDEQQLAML